MSFISLSASVEMLFIQLLSLRTCLIPIICKASLYVLFRVRCCSGTLLKNSVLAVGKVKHSGGVR